MAPSQVVHTEAYIGTVKELLALAGSVEQCSNHPLAAAVVGAAAVAGAATDVPLTSAHIVPGVLPSSFQHL
jgi:cation transport ATPase